MINFQITGVVGAGTMGHGIAQVLAQSGCTVLLTDDSETALKRAHHKIEASLTRLEQRGLISESQLPQIMARIEPRQTIAELASCRIVIEAASEAEGVKRAIFTELDHYCSRDAILASNTSSIPLTRIAGWTRFPERVIGMHFMNPVQLMPLVEIVRALQTSDETWHTVEELATHLDKTPVTVNDAPGFVSNRVLMPMINEAIFALHDGVADAKAIDSIMKLGMHHPLGPLALADLIGLDTCLAIMDQLYQAFCDSKYRPCPLLTRMVEAGRLGQKTGLGFYPYD